MDEIDLFFSSLHLFVGPYYFTNLLKAKVEVYEKISVAARAYNDNQYKENKGKSFRFHLPVLKKDGLQLIQGNNKTT